MSIIAKSQNNASNNVEVKSEKKSKTWDTLKYKKYERVLIVGLFQQFRNFNNSFEQKMTKDSLGISATEFAAESKLIGGILLNYDKFQLSFGTRTQPQALSEGKGTTNTFNIGLNIGDNRWVSENYFRRFTGFYNTKTANFDTAFKRTGNYFLQPNLKSTLLSSRFMYFTNYKRYSFKAGFGCNYRQLKSAITWVVGGNFNVYTLSNDSAIIPLKIRSYYNDYGAMKGFQSVNIGVGGGLAGTLVFFKAWFIGGYLTIGPEQQWRSYNLSTQYKNLSYVSWSGTARFTMGLNLKRCYFNLASASDFNLYDSKKTLSILSISLTQNFSFGWRFQSKTPKFYQKFMNTKIYSYL